MMKTAIISIITLTGGVCVGYVIGAKTAAKKYRAQAEAEIESVKTSLEAYYKEKQTTVSPEPTKHDSIPEKKQKKNDLIDKDSIDYDMLKNNQDTSKYFDYTRQYNKVEEKEKPAFINDSSNAAYIITPQEFANSEYDIQELTYYSDGVLADEDYNIIKDIKGTVGSEALNSFGKFYEDDAVYVRNPITKTDFEILIDSARYKDIAPKSQLGQFPGDDEDYE